MKKKFKAFSHASKEFWRFLQSLMDSYAGNKGPIDRIMRDVCGNAWKGVVVEEDYVDKDFQDEFSAFYSKAFKTYSPRCVRLHFFSKKVSQKNIENFSLPVDSYLGFMVVRPTDLQRVGRTVLKPHIDENKNVFITCQEEFCAHILGERLTVKGMPFIQQDTQVGVCAQASLWMLARYMSRRFGLRDYLPAEINQFAKSHSAGGRILPSERGLGAIQMLDALQEMGLSAEFIEKSNIGQLSEKTALPDSNKQIQNLARPGTLAEIAYRHIESKLPVIFLTKDHALVGVGHSYDFDKQVNGSFIERIPSFYVNDDATGPYQEMPIFEANKNGGRSFLDVECLILVSPQEVTLQGMYAENMANTSLRQLLLEKDLLKKIEEMRPELVPLLSSLEYRTYVQASVEFQEQLLRCVKQNPASALARTSKQLLKLDYPKYIWITEISSSLLLKKRRKSKRQCLGRIIVDSTAPRVTYGTIAIHFADVLVIRDRQKPFSDKEAWHRSVIHKSTPFVHMFTADN